MNCECLDTCQVYTDALPKIKKILEQFKTLNFICYLSMQTSGKTHQMLSGFQGKNSLKQFSILAVAI